MYWLQDLLTPISDARFHFGRKLTTTDISVLHQVINDDDQEAYKGEIQCPLLPNQICLLTNHNMFHAANLQLLLLSSNQSTLVHRK